MLVKSDDLKRNDEFIDLSKYIQLVKRNLLAIVVFAVFVTACVTFYVLTITPEFKATSTLLIENQQKKVISIEQVVGVDTSKQEYYQTQYEIIRSNRIAEKVISDLGIGVIESANNAISNSGEPSGLKAFIKNAKETVYNLPVLSNYIKKPLPVLDEQLEDSHRQRVLREFKSNLSVTPVKNTQLVHITFLSKDPLMAANVANAVGEAYIQNHVESQLEANQQASIWINSRLGELQLQLQASELKLAQFMEREGLVDAAGIDSLATTELTNLTNQLSEARDRRLAAESLYSVLQKNRDADLSSLYAIKQVSNHPQIRDIRSNEVDAEKRVFELSKRYGPKHDKMIRAQAELKALQNRSTKILKQLVVGIEKELSTALEQERGLKRELELKKKEFQSVTLKKAEFETLRREVNTNRQLYDLFLTRQKETSATSDYQNAIARFTDRASIPLVPAKPRKVLIIAISAVSAFIIGLAAAFILEAMRNTFERRADVEEKVGLTGLGSVPKIIAKKYRKSKIGAELFLDKEHKDFGESIRSIRTSLILSLMQSKRKCVAITSPISGEGKTTVSVALAESFAAMEKVLLIDCDLRKPSVGERFSLSNAQPGMTNYLLMGAELEDCIYHHEESGLDVMTSGLLIPNPQELLGSEQYKEMIESLSEKYDRIIIDTPPVNVVSDPMLVANVTTSCVMVVKANSTKVNQLNFAISRMLKYKSVIEGVVLNQDQSKTQDAYQYYGYEHS
ncbi:GumC family protein [Vibrio nigripulchritudo]|uniref:GumC family protein n=1 Tax=Vibrio nigripulchritudo TaxID=28173 RepID=UPI002492FB4D|nr:polysaccharide biosynthesis tyrosine autokinase [Vibrio nigripulchritudo]BDU40573.1 chain-length determining protein [Vibrio nigripulchritudo]BDU46310.1 chain-length determining protein [Vibrio nigripulchritudo]